MIHHYITIALRHLWKYKVQNLIGIVGLAVGMLCFSICLYCYRFFNDLDACFSQQERIAMLWLETTNEEGEKWNTTLSSSDFADMLRKQPLSTAEAFCSVIEAREPRSYAVEVKGGALQPYELLTIEVDTFFRKVFTPVLLYGNWEVIQHAPNTVLLSESASRRIFGKGVNPVGKSMTLSRKLRSSPESTPFEGGITYTIQGVVQDLPLNNSLSFMRQVDMWTLNDSEGWINCEWRNSSSNAFNYALLREGCTSADLDKELKERKITFREFEKDFVVCATPINTKYKEGTKMVQQIVLALGSLILIVGLLNFFYFLIGSFYSRMHEYAVRKAMGSSALHLFCMLVVQVFFLLCMAGMVMMSGIELVAPHLQFTMVEFVLSIDSEILYHQAWGYWGILSVLCILVCVCTALTLQYRTKYRGISVITRKRKTNYLRNTLFGVQFFICWIFVVCTAGLFMQSQKTAHALFETLSTAEKESIFHLNLDYAFLTSTERDALIGRIAASSGVKTLSRTMNELISGQTITSVREPRYEDPREGWEQAGYYEVDTSFFSLMNLPLLSGRIMGPGEAVVNEAFATHYGNVLGKPFDNYSSLYTISGVTRNFIITTHPVEKAYNLKFFCLIQRPQYAMHCYIKPWPGQEESVKEHIEKEMRSILPESVNLKLSTISEDLREFYFLEYKLRDLILFLSIVSILITMLGVYSAITLDTARRQKEVAVRKVNGANTGKILFLFARLYILLLGISALCAFPLLYLLFGEWTKMYTVTFSYGPLFWICIFLIVSAVTALTVFLKILRIARINPAEILKNE